MSPDPLPLSAIQLRLLRALARVHAESSARKSVVVLRYALLEANRYDEGLERALCNGGDEHPLVDEYYAALRTLVRDSDFAEGAGDLRQPAGPRYTECWITQRGLEYLDAASRLKEG